MKRTVKPLLERIAIGPQSQVDWESYALRGVKILGLSSRNKREYQREGVEKAVPLYEGKPVKTDHPKSETEARKQRGILETCGWLKNVHMRDDGMFGDLELLKHHPASPVILEAAERKPDLFCLSHNADGQGYVDANGKYIIESIPDVRSVDVIEFGRGGTTKSLFESTTQEGDMKTTTLLSLIKRSKIPSKVRRILYEMDGTGLDIGMDVPVADAPEGEPPPTPTGNDIGGKIGELVALLVQSEDPKAHDFLEKIVKELREFMGTGDTELGNADEPDKTPDDDDDEEESPVTESIAQNLCQLAGVRPGKALLESMQQAKTIEGATALVREFKAASPQPTRKESPASSGKSKPVTEAKQEEESPADQFPKTKEELCAAMAQHYYR